MQENNFNRPYSNEIQLEIDDVYGCPGHCPGCVLSSLEKKSFEPDMEFSILKNSIEKLKEYVPTLKNLEKINLTYGIADHLLMSNEYLEKTYSLGADLIESVGLKNEYNGVFFSASMIGKHELIMEKINYLHNVSKKRGVRFYIIAVLDPKNLHHKKFSEIYQNNIIKTNELIGKVDLSINLSEEAVNNISPKELYDFAVYNQFDEVTINWTPTNDNINYVYFNQEKLAKWLIDFDELISSENKLSTSYRPVILKTINNLMCKAGEDYSPTFLDDVENNLSELINKSLQIDHLGNVFPKYEAIGDIAHSPRLGIKEIGNVSSNKSIQQMLADTKNQTKYFIIKQFTKEPCVSCEYNRFCANSGFHIYNHVLNGNADLNIKQTVKNNVKNLNCYHTAKILFDHYKNKIKN